MKSFLLLAGALAALAPGAAQADAPSVHIVLKFVKERASGPVAALDPASCRACVVGHDPGFERDNARETLLDLHVPAGRFLELAFDSPANVRRVVLEAADMPLHREGKRLIVALPPLRGDMIESGEFSTHIVEPGMVLRFEHADPARLAGDYAGQPVPKVQRDAANVLEFAEREAIRETGLGEHVAREGLGVIEIMGFDTNNPHGHRDAPAHMHMHLRWPFNIGTQIGHYYLTPQGLLAHDQVGVTGYHMPTRDFGPGQSFTTMDNHGQAAYTQTITQQGWLTFSTSLPGGTAQSCRITPLTQGQGFDSGAQVACDGHEAQAIRVSDDLDHGVVTVSTGAVTETFRYDRDTGLLASPTMAPPLPDSAVIPTARTQVPLGPGFALPAAAGEHD